jgi:Undecaprenyl-phosphate glucose phosphotransferase
MLKKYGQFFASILFISDSLIVFFSWISAYSIRFQWGIFSSPQGVPPFDVYLLTSIPIWIIFSLNIKWFNLYEPLRGKSAAFEYFSIIKVASVSVLMLTAVSFFYRGVSYSRLTVIIFWVVVSILMIITHALLRQGLMQMRRKGINLRQVLIVGSGDLGKSVADKIDLHPEIGFKIVGFLSHIPGDVGKKLGKYEVLGDVKEVSRFLEEKSIDQLFIALPLNAPDCLEDVLKDLREEKVDIQVVPDLMKFMNLSSGIEDFDGLPIVNLTGTPLYGWNIIIKRITDIVCAGIGLIVLGPFMALIALLIRLESKGKVIYSQERVGLDGQVFSMMKFRSMLEGAEQKSGPVWAIENDDRKTRIGNILRKTSLDELPQLFNILKGEMSLVGPRPERPHFVENFKKSIPSYMLRLKMKAGLTGWAQVNGWRGNTSLEKRIEYDLYYIKHWSFWFDIKIMAMTFWKGLINKHAY